MIATVDSSSFYEFIHHGQFICFIESFICVPSKVSPQLCYRYIIDPSRCRQPPFPFPHSLVGGANRLGMERDTQRLGHSHSAFRSATLNHTNHSFPANIRSHTFAHQSSRLRLSPPSLPVSRASRQQGSKLSFPLECAQVARTRITHSCARSSGHTTLRCAFALVPPVRRSTRAGQ